MASYSWFQGLIQKLAASAPGSWLLSRLLHHLDPLVYRWSARRFTLTGLLSGVPVMLVTTRGAKSGRPRTLPLVPVRLAEPPGAFALVASSWGQARHPDWYYNLKAHPHATCMVAGRQAHYQAREAEGDEYDRCWQAALNTYFGFSRYQARAGRRIPILVLTPE